MTAEASLVVCQGHSGDNMAKPCRRIADASVSLTLALARSLTTIR